MKFLAIILMLFVTSCSTTNVGLLGELQTRKQIADNDVPTILTDLAILRLGEKQLADWGFRSKLNSTLEVGGALVLAGLSTAAMSTGDNGYVSGFNAILQFLGIIKPSERNSARYEGASMIIDARGAFIEALAAKKVGVISNRRFTPQGALYLKQIGAAVSIVDRLMIGIRPRIDDLKAMERIPVEEQENPEPEPQPPIVVPSGVSIPAAPTMK